MADLKKGARITGSTRDKLVANLKKKYERGASIRALAESTGRSYGFVHRALRESGVQLRGRSGGRLAAVTAGQTQRRKDTAQTTSRQSEPDRPSGRQGGPKRTGLVSVDELARRKGIKPKTVDALACHDAFDTDEELDEFLAFVTEQRRANLA